MDRERTIEAYKPLRKHAELFDDVAGWQAEWFDIRFIQALNSGSDSAWNDIVTTHLPGAVFSCKIFTDQFCDMLISEVDHFSKTGLPARRPNTMNNYGIILNDIGWKPMVDVLQRTVLSVVAKRYWPEVYPFDSHHTFIVRYKEGEDLGLDMHTDASDVTFNVCLGKQFSGAGLSFCGVKGLPGHRKHSLTYHHEKGRCCWHLGRQRHGADDITSGERLNLIIWNNSSAYKKTLEAAGQDYYKEEGPPDSICLSYTHDRDYGVFKDYVEKNEDFAGRGWCPPRGAEHDGFVPESGGQARVRKSLEPSCSIV